MTRRRWVSFGCMVLGAVLAAPPAWAQLSLPPAGPSGGGFAGANSGGYGASVPLDFPPAHGGLPVPVQITYSEHGVGAAGRGWDVPLSYIRRDNTVVHRRPVGTANVAPAPREQVSLTLDGRSMDLLPLTTGDWIARNDDAQLQVRSQSDGSWVAYDGQGRAPSLDGGGDTLSAPMARVSDATSASLGSIVGSGSSGTVSQPISRSSSARSIRARVMRQ